MQLNFTSLIVILITVLVPIESHFETNKSHTSAARTLASAPICSNIFLNSERPLLNGIYLADGQLVSGFKQEGWGHPPNQMGTEVHERLLTANPGLQDLLDASAGVREGYTIREHNLRLFDVFEEIKPQFMALPIFQKSGSARMMELFKYTIALHDIGKPLAIKNGNKDDQHIYTLPILTRELTRLGFTKKEIRISQALVDNDVFGDLLRGKSTVDEVLAELQKLSRTAGMDVESYAALQALFYTMDASSYPILRQQLFAYDQANQMIPTSQLYENLMAKISLQQPRNRFEILRNVVPPSLVEAWSSQHFTDPAKHSPDKFRYLIHGTNSEAFFTSFLKRGAIDSFSQISLSAVDQNHTNSFVPAGVILDVPSENIFAAHPADMLSSTIMQANHMNPSGTYLDTLPALYKTYGLPSPEQIITKTIASPAINTFGHNEVVATSIGINGKSLKIKGVFFVVDSLGQYLAKPDLFAKIQGLASKYSLPMIPLGPGKGFVTIRMDKTSISSSRTVRVYCTRKEFAQLQESAQRLGVNLIGIGNGHTHAVGAFYHDKFISHARADAKPETLQAARPDETYSIQFNEDAEQIRH